MTVRINNIAFYRLVARLLPLKNKLNFLIRKFTNNSSELVIPYYKDFAICIVPNRGNTDTLSDLIFEGARYLPEYSLANRIKEELPSSFTYVDIGSNIGTTIWLFADKASRVLAFEPIPHLYNTIESSIRQNGTKNVLLRKKAIGERSGTIFMHNNDNSSVLTIGAGQEAIEAIVSTLDDEMKAETRIDLIKIDVEGFELEVLNGAKASIDKFRPKILLELHPGFIKSYGHTIYEVINFLNERNYRIDYYSFLNSLRLPKILRVLKRLAPERGKRFNGLEEFENDLKHPIHLSSYHLYCEPK